jgi:hypothetical protein
MMGELEGTPLITEKVIRKTTETPAAQSVLTFTAKTL